MSPRRICFVSDDFLPAATGVGNHLQLLTREFVRRGYQVSVLTSRRRGEPKTEVWEGARIHRFPTLKVYDFYQALPTPWAIRRALLEEKPDLIHYHYAGLMTHMSSIIGRRDGVPQVYSYHFDARWLTQPWPLRPLRAWFQRMIVACQNRCDFVISPSRNSTEELVQSGVHVPIQVIANPVIFDESSRSLPAQPTSGFTLLYAGRLAPEKNIELLLMAFRQVRQQIPEATLWIAGRGPLQEKLQRLSAELGISNSVRFLGFLDSKTLASYYAGCHVFVLPSVMEVHPLVAIEAMEFAKPIIVTSAIVSATELVTPGVNGYIVDPEDADALAMRLLELAMNPGARATMGHSGLEKAREFRPEIAIAALEEIYRRVVESSR